jgi:DNA-binding MarR family transcriptional regulator
MPDILVDQAHLFLGSRLKRLAERLQGDAAKLIREAGFDLQPAQMPLLAALDRYGPLTVGDAVAALGVSQPAVTRSALALVEAGLLTGSKTEADLRQKTLALTPAGAAAVQRAKAGFWKLVDDAVRDLCGGLSGSFLEQLSGLEAALDRSSLEDRVGKLGQQPRVAHGLQLREYSDELAEAFARINAEWIASMFTMEENDRQILANPRSLIIDRGGVILFVEADGAGIVGTCALLRIEEGVFELTKMGVLESARGLKAGEFLLRQILDRARGMQMRRLYLLTSSKCEAAIHLYEKLGFVHDATVMQDYGSRYARCNVAMSYPLGDTCHSAN